MQQLVDRFGFLPEVVNIWRAEVGDSLLEVQVKALEYGLLNGASLLVTAPSSSGKTFVGEMAAINAYYKRKRTFFLVPMKALAEERYAEFKSKYEAFGLEIAVSSHDRTEFDSSILNGRFHIAVVVFEKMNVLMTQHPAVVNNCGLVVVDEIQTLNDPERGPELEILLTKIKTANEKAREPIQIVCLSAVLGDLNGLDRWLGATHCDVRSRPLELHEAVLSPDGTLRIRESITGIERTEVLQGISGVAIPKNTFGAASRARMEQSILERLSIICRKPVSEGKHVLIFRKWRPIARDTAQYLSKTLGLPPATRIIQELRDVESTNSENALHECLNGGVAFHTADLAVETRLALEKAFRDPQGQIGVMVATSTLSVGVNLPSSIVVIPDTLKPDSQSEGRLLETPITTSEYKNMAGRAGRTRFGEEGLSILVANSAAEASQYWQTYVKGQFESLRPPLEGKDHRKIILGLLASGLCKNEVDISNLLLASYTGFVSWNKGPATRQALEDSIKRSCEFLIQNGLIERCDGTDLAATKMGRLCGVSGVQVETFVVLRETVEKIDPARWDPWEVIFPCMHPREVARDIDIYLTRESDPMIIQRLEEIDPPNRNGLLTWSNNTTKSVERTQGRVKAFLILRDWIHGIETSKIEDTYGVRNRFLSATIRTISERSSWLVEVIARIALQLDCGASFVEQLYVLSERLRYGVPEEGIALRKLGVRGVTRTVVRRLVDNGFASPDRILDTPPADFKNIINPSLAQRIQEAYTNDIQDSLERSKYTQINRLNRRGNDATLLRAIYEEESKALEAAVVNLLNAPPLNLPARRIETQRQGEPDIVMTIDAGTLVASVTASKTNISDSKCAEIIRSGAAYNAASYVVFGRPGFHRLAIENSANINTQLAPGKSYKLMTVQDLGELYVRVVEGDITRDLFIETLMRQKGLVKSRQIRSDGQG
ncbi:MAG: DEAD/DEAH box helicase [Firmicutes bacterium]|nr:DEAD/DEAH box helicase [Bacillota bacterium]